MLWRLFVLQRTLRSGVLTIPSRFSFGVANPFFTADESFFRNVIRINHKDADSIIADLRKIRMEHLSKQLSAADEIWKENARKEIKDMIAHIRENGQQFPPAKSAAILNGLSRLNDFYSISRDNYARRALYNVFTDQERIQEVTPHDCSLVLKSIVHMEEPTWKVTPLPDDFLSKLVKSLVDRVLSHPRHSHGNRKRIGKWLDAHVTALQAVASYAAVLPHAYVINTATELLRRLMSHGRMQKLYVSETGRVLWSCASLANDLNAHESFGQTVATLLTHLTTELPKLNVRQYSADASANGLTALAVFHELFQKEDVEKMAITLAESMGQRVAFETCAPSIHHGTERYMMAPTPHPPRPEHLGDTLWAMGLLRTNLSGPAYAVVKHWAVYMLKYLAHNSWTNERLTPRDIADAMWGSALLYGPKLYKASKRTHAVEAICDQFRELFAAALTPDIVRMLTALRVACIRDAELLGLVEERILASRDMLSDMSISEVTEVALALANFRAGSAQLWERVEARVVDRDALEKLRRGNADMLEPECIDADIAIDLLYAFATRGQLSERLLHMMLDALAQRPSDLSKLDDGCILKLHTVRLATEKTERATGGAGFTQMLHDIMATAGLSEREGEAVMNMYRDIHEMPYLGERLRRATVKWLHAIESDGMPDSIRGDQNYQMILERSGNGLGGQNEDGLRVVFGARLPKSGHVAFALADGCVVIEPVTASFYCDLHSRHLSPSGFNIAKAAQIESVDRLLVAFFDPFKCREAVLKDARHEGQTVGRMQLVQDVVLAALDKSSSVADGYT